MSLVTQIREIFVAQHPVDFRKGFNSLLAECYHMQLDPYRGQCVVFVHRSWKQMKAIVGDEKGLFLVQRRFEGGRLKKIFEFMDVPAFVTISQAEVALLFEGASYSIESRVRPWRQS